MKNFLGARKDNVRGGYKYARTGGFLTLPHKNTAYFCGDPDLLGMTGRTGWTAGIGTLGQWDFSTTLEMTNNTCHVERSRNIPRFYSKSPRTRRTSKSSSFAGVLTLAYNQKNARTSVESHDVRAFLAWDCKGQIALCRGVGAQPTWGQARRLL